MKFDVDMSPPANTMSFRLTLTHVTYQMTLGAMVHEMNFVLVTYILTHRK